MELAKHNLEEELETLEDLRKRVEEDKHSVGFYSTNVANIKAEENPYDTMLSKARERFDKVEDDYERNLKTSKVLKTQVENLHYAVKALAPAGIRGLMLEKITPPDLASTRSRSLRHDR